MTKREEKWRMRTGWLQRYDWRGAGSRFNRQLPHGAAITTNFIHVCKYADFCPFTIDAIDRLPWHDRRSIRQHSWPLYQSLIAFSMPHSEYAANEPGTRWQRWWQRWWRHNDDSIAAWEQQEMLSSPIKPESPQMECYYYEQRWPTPYVVKRRKIRATSTAE